ncbi:MAG: glycosyltransferase [Pseudomonadota bacterium]
MSSGQFDAILIVDPRFSGGTATAFATDVRTLAAAGVSLGVHFVRCEGYFQPHEAPNSDLLTLLDLDHVRAIDQRAVAKAPITLFHHPLPFAHGVETVVQIESSQAAIISHQAPFKGNGALDYDPFVVQRQIKRQFGLCPRWAPISGVSRSQLKSFAPALRLTREDWPNTFNTTDWTPARKKLSGPQLTVGRHGRPHPEKWGETGAEITASLPSNDNTKIRVMGSGPDFFAQMGVDTQGWDVLPFNGEPVPAFLDRLDVFSYFYDPLWTETFGRTVAEAMLMGARCILPRSLEPTFGPHAIYCRPADVADVLQSIRADLAGHRDAAAKARAFCIEMYSTDTVVARLDRFVTDPGTISRAGDVASPPLTTLRKYAGYHRRRLSAPKGLLP